MWLTADVSRLSDRDLRFVMQAERHKAHYGYPNELPRMQRELERRAMRGLRLIPHVQVGEA